MLGALEGDHILEADTQRNGDLRGKAIRVAIIVGNVFYEQHEQNVLTGIHAATQLIAVGPDEGVEGIFF
jgi:hypothetical protein